jgi:hypothetical protein
MNAPAPVLPLTATDTLFEGQFRDRHREQSALVILRGPSVGRDLDRALARPGFRPVTIGVNIGALRWLTDYAVAMDAHAFRPYDLGGFRGTCFVMPDIAPCRTLALANPSANCAFWTEPPDLPPGEGRFNRKWPRPWGHGSYTCMAALWLAWYMGCRGIRTAGADFAVTDVIHGDQAEIASEDEKERYRAVLPDMRRAWAELVGAIRNDGVTVDWPQEGG